MRRKRLKQKYRVQEVKREVGTKRWNPRGEKEWRVLGSGRNKKMEKGFRWAPAMKK